MTSIATLNIPSQSKQVCLDMREHLLSSEAMEAILAQIYDGRQIIGAVVMLNDTDAMRQGDYCWQPLPEAVEFAASWLRKQSPRDLHMDPDFFRLAQQFNSTSWTPAEVLHMVFLPAIRFYLEDYCRDVQKAGRTLPEFQAHTRPADTVPIAVRWAEELLLGGVISADTEESFRVACVFNCQFPVRYDDFQRMLQQDYTKVFPLQPPVFRPQRRRLEDPENASILQYMRDHFGRE